MNDPLVKGGQGKSAAEVKESAFVVGVAIAAVLGIAVYALAYLFVRVIGSILF